MSLCASCEAKASLCTACHDKSMKEVLDTVARLQRELLLVKTSLSFAQAALKCTVKSN